MFLRLLFLTSLVSILFACGSDSRDDSKGEVKYAGSHTKNGKEFMVVSYYKDDAEDRMDNEQDAHFYYVRTYTIDVKTGKVVYQTEVDVSENGGDFIGATEKYLFYESNEGVFAIDVFQSGKMITPSQVLKMIGRINPKLNGHIVSLKISTEEKMVIQTENADVYILDPKTFKAMIETYNNEYGRDYRVSITQARYCPLCFESTSYDMFFLNDSISLYLRWKEGEPQEKKFLSIEVDYPTTKIPSSYEQIDKTAFINGFPIGAKDSIVYFSYLTNLSKTGTYKLAAYDWGKHQFLWSKNINSLYEPNEFGNFSTAWNDDGTAFLLWGTDVVSFIDAKTGKKVWKF